MLVFKILSTIFIGISVVTALYKNATVLVNDSQNLPIYILLSLYSVAWRTLVIVTIWII